MNNICCVCDRVPWGEVQRLGHGKWRHAECAPGSKAWAEYYQALPLTQRVAEGELLLRYYQSTHEQKGE
jgi:hypothetical protein